MKLISLKAVIDGDKCIGCATAPPCTCACPAGVQAHDYVSLVHSGRYEDAFRLHMEDAPLPGVLGRACYAPCESQCTHGRLPSSSGGLGTVGIRAVKRFMADYYYARHPEPEYRAPAPRNGKLVAVVGSGPAGLSAAYFLAKRGYAVTILEAAPQAGGMLRYGIPPYRLPRPVLERDLLNIRALGVEFRMGEAVSSVAELKANGYSAAFVAVGTMEPQPLNIPGSELKGVMAPMAFLKAANTGSLDLSGKSVAVIGGGNVAMDSARMALRAGAKQVAIYYRRMRQEMPAHDWEVQAALDEGVVLHELKKPTRFLGRNGTLTGIEVQATRLGAPDASGRPSPEPVPGSEQPCPVDLVIPALGLRPSTAPFAGELRRHRNETLVVDTETLATEIPGVFAGGDAVTGPSMIIAAIAQGKRAAFHIDRYLRGEVAPAVFDTRPPLAVRGAALPGNEVAPYATAKMRELPPLERARSTAEIEAALSEEQAVAEAARCLECGACAVCNSVCPTLAISRNGPQPLIAEVDCRGCGACEQRCPVYAIGMQKLDTPYTVSVAVEDVPYDKIAALCVRANLNPEQIICYCTATRAEEVAAAILKGARSPEEVSRRTGVRTGCKVECIQPVLRLLQAAGVTPERPAGWQWYGLTPAVWNIPEEIKSKYNSRGFYFAEDIELFKQAVAAKSERRDS
jgi:heterodisulfide reductase subunit A